MTTLDDIKAAATALSPLAHLATVAPDNTPDVVPVHPAWEGDTIWVMSHVGRKTRNLAENPAVALHWQVTEAGDGVEIWGTATVHDDVETKRRLWTGVFDYDIGLFSPGGPDDSPETVFIAIEPERALSVLFYGINGRATWRRQR